MSESRVVNVKWTNGKETFKGIDLSFDEPPSVFKAQLFALTNVPPERQKIMMKGKLVGDGDIWSENIKSVLKDNAVLMLMGSKDEIVAAPVEKPKFVEDMEDHQVAAAYDMPAGLANLGNTCYMNASIQCLRTIPELSQALSGYKPTPPALGDVDMVHQLQQLYDKTLSLEVPEMVRMTSLYMFLTSVHRWRPRFSEKGEGGHYMQQDANEFYIEVVNELRQRLKLNNTDATTDFVTKYMGLDIASKTKCLESEEEPEKSENEREIQLSCFLSQATNHLYSGIKLKLTETITKHSSILSRDAEFQKTSLINRLPGYLCVQLVRFQYKQNKNVNAKVLKDVKFNMELDLYDLCTPELKTKLDPMRALIKEEDDANALAIKRQKVSGEQMAAVDPNKALEYLPYALEEDVGSSNSGKYQLHAVLTHKGRDSSSGHYIAWVRKHDDFWYKCDDDTISAVTNDEILKLSGGGDWHMAYLMFYKSRAALKQPHKDEPMETSAAESTVAKPPTS